MTDLIKTAHGILDDLAASGHEPHRGRHRLRDRQVDGADDPEAQAASRCPAAGAEDARVRSARTGHDGVPLRGVVK